MNFSIAWQKLNQIGQDLMAALSNMVFEIVVLVLFVVLARGVRAGVRRVTSKKERLGSGLALQQFHYRALDNEIALQSQAPA